MIRRVGYKGHYGLVCKGRNRREQISKDAHWIDKAEWLTSMVECGGYYGVVINYDRTAITAGLHQAIGVYPKTGKQGPLWGLLDQMKDLPAARALIEEFAEYKFRIHEGKFKYLFENTQPDVRRIYELLCGTESGDVPKEGPGYDRAVVFVSLFSDLFNDPSTFEIQNEFGIRWIDRIIKKPMLEKSERTIAGYLTYRNMWPGELREIELSEEQQLAMTVFLSYSVNAPDFAVKKIQKTIKRVGLSNDFARALVESLGTSSFGHWSASLLYGRYQRTRKYAKRIFDSKLFNLKGVMPSRF